MTGPDTVVLLDWNGTVVLDTDRARSSVNAVLANRALPILNSSRFQQTFHLPMTSMFHGLGVEDGDEAEREWNDAMSRAITFAREGVHYLWQLHHSGTRLGVVSAAFSHAVHADIENLSLDGLWDSVDAPSRDKLTTLKERRGTEEHAFYVGDTPYDMQCAIGAGYTPVAVDRGYIPPRELTAAGAVTVISDFTELSDLINSPRTQPSTRSPRRTR